ncbi:MAG: DUF6695 family protein [Wenyingzhuangia sp.]|uniref:DUF6695 family protein n=1 Tax=Wenyingzhuangia sp. TaxID=1964193 RepID=UPI003219FBC6
MSDGAILVLSYPDTIVRPAYTEFSSRIWPKLGIGGNHAVQAGHAALLLIHKNTQEVDYFDFGRYITSYGFGRVRSKDTDPELELPFKANFENDKLVNLSEMLLWLENNTEKTHGEGRLIVGLNTQIDYDKAISFVEKLLALKELPYGAFVKNGSNCARFVADVLKSSCVNKSVLLRLKISNLLTPSPISNVIKGSTESDIYIVTDQKIGLYKNRSILREYRNCLLKEFSNEVCPIGTELPNRSVFNPKDATWLGGIGSGAWFSLSPTKIEGRHIISRFTDRGYKDFEGFFKSSIPGFNPEEPHEFVYPTNCSVAYIIQDTNIYVYRKVNSKPS